mgnify:CR=1 FL=1
MSGIEFGLLAFVFLLVLLALRVHIAVAMLITGIGFLTGAVTSVSSANMSPMATSSQGSSAGAGQLARAMSDAVWSM